MRFLTTDDVTAAIGQLIREAQEELVLVTPYLKLPKTIAERLIEVDRRDVPITLLYGKDKLADGERKTLEQFSNLSLRFYKDLHAKCYYTERGLVLTSMNLYTYSVQNNREMGVYVEAGSEVYKQAVAETESILAHATAERLGTGSKKSKSKASPRSPKRGVLGKAADRFKKATAPTGHCLRCGTDVPLDPEAPYCKKCFGSWVRFKNPTYEEAHCHACGKDHKSSLKKPVCLPCYRKLAA